MTTPAASQPHRSRLLYQWFAWWVRGYLKKHFHAVRLARGTRPNIPPDSPLIVVLNHPSWWDPLVGMVLTGLFPDRNHFGPMDAASLERYSLFKRLGFYGVDQGGSRGAASFLRTTTAILSQPNSAVWITAQGRFADARVRPPRLRPGIGHIVRRVPRCVVVPLALEYPYWEERLPEALARFGAPILIENGRNSTVMEWVERIESNLATTQDALMAEAMVRNVNAFETLLSGKAAIGGVYDRFRTLAAWLRGERFRAEHRAEKGRP